MEELIQFIQNKSFPCIMAKAVINTGRLKAFEVEDIENEACINEIQNQLYDFVDDFRRLPKKLSSFALIIRNDRYKNFDLFEHRFWNFLNKLSLKDKNLYPHDPRVSSDPHDENYSFSIKSEAFFMVAMHPESPRWARRFPYPTIIFNPHIQFEELREKGVFKKVRDLIRLRDKLLQGASNPMLTDFGEKSEVFQYMGKVYQEDEPIPLSA